jgi:CHAD domain-containing protein
MSYHLKRSDESVQAGLRRIAVSQLDKALAEIDDDTLDVHETVHQVRKRCKKLRGLIRLVRPAFADYRAENSEFRDAASTLSYIRDAQAMIETYDDLVAHYDTSIDRQACASIRDGLADRKEAIAREKGLDEKLSAFRQRMVAARDRAAAWELDADGFDAVGAGLAKTYKRATRAIDRARDAPTAENLHELRKRAKYHWYHTSLVRSAWADLLQTHRDIADALADLLGDHHNLAVFRSTMVTDQQAFAEPTHVEALAGLAERRQAALAAEAFAIGLRLFGESPSALRRRWGVYWQVWQSEKALRKELVAP